MSIKHLLLRLNNNSNYNRTFRVIQHTSSNTQLYTTQFLSHRLFYSMPLNNNINNNGILTTTTHQQANNFSTQQQRSGVESDDNNITNNDNTTTTTAAQQNSKSQPRRVRVYTKTGDSGTSVLYNMMRTSKSSDTFDALGTIDELNAFIGLTREYCNHIQDLAQQLEYIQARLLDIGSHVATPLSTSNEKQLQRTIFDHDNITLLEQWIDCMDDTLPPLRNFILPSGGLASSHLHICRSVCRRAERTCIPLLERNDISVVVVKYMNRLSDYLFVAARYAAKQDNKQETVWTKPRKRNDNDNTKNNDGTITHNDNEDK